MSICCFDLWSQLRNIMSADRNSICSITMLRTIISFLFTLSLLDSEPLPWSFHRHRGGGWYIPIWRKWGRDKIGPWLDPFWDAGATLNENVFGKASLKWSLAYLAPAQPSSRPWANKPCHAWIKTSILHEPWQWSELTDKKKKKYNEITETQLYQFWEYEPKFRQKRKTYVLFQEMPHEPVTNMSIRMAIALGIWQISGSREK